MLEATITLAIELLFGLVFVASLVDHARRHDPLSLDHVAGIHALCLAGA